MMAMMRYAIVVAAGGVLALGAVGCANPEVQERSAHRIWRMERTAALATEREAKSPPNMRWTLDLAVEREARSPVNLERDLLGSMIRRDLERWPERQLVHGAWLNDLFDGDIPNLERTIPNVFN